ncbi:MAG: aminotransferase class V-fold PLP-dependent enzyme [Planctomycetota bacterium]
MKDAKLRQHWLLDPEVTFLNHGSFGACPRPVLEAQEQWRRRLEAEPVHFMVDALENELDDARARLARFVGAQPQDLAFVPNPTSGVNAVLQSLPLQAGDELLTTGHAYGACHNALEYVAQRSGATVVVAPLPFPGIEPDLVVDAVREHITPRTRLALLDHVTSATGVVLPIAALVAELRERGIETLIDGAHAPGMVELDIEAIGATYYAGHCHKWLCAPKGAAFLWVQRDRQDRVRPVVISHGARSRRTDRSRFLCEFDWVGTADPSPYLCVPTAIDFLGSLLPGGWPALRAHNRDLALRARELLCASLGVEAPAPASMIGSLAAVPLPDGSGPAPTSWRHVEPIKAQLFQQYHIEIPVSVWPAPPKRLLRLSAQIYNREDEYHALSAALRELLAGEQSAAS